jgi:acyl-CoA reductase-like NAD-dependent aldehyde dehydrogenase
MASIVPVVDPSTGELVRELVSDGKEEVSSKVARARAVARERADSSLDERRETLRRFGEILASRTDELATTTSRETGKPVTQAKNEIAGLRRRVDFFLKNVEPTLRERVVHESPDITEVVRHEPLGVVANVSAWNYPYFVGGNVFVPALLAGNVVVYKPSEYASLTGLALAAALHDAGVPRDAFVTVIGDGITGAQLVDAAVDAVFFTGSHATGQRIARAVAPRFLKLGLELGGKDPAYVTDDVDVAAAAAAVADGAFYNTGQSCCAVERIYVHRAIWRPFLEQFVETVKGFKVGDPRDPTTYIGPLARRDAALELLEGQVKDAVERGARLLLGGARVDRPGFYFQPTVLVDVDHEMRVMREESFGPIIGLMPVADDGEALSLMQDTEYGLTAAVYSKRRARAETLLASLDVGSAYWNCCDRVSPELPWSGRRASGSGYTLSTYGIEAFTKLKAWHLRAS